LDKWVEVGHTTCPLCRNGLWIFKVFKVLGFSIRVFN
jgi:hypothetical protein